MRNKYIYKSLGNIISTNPTQYNKYEEDSRPIITSVAKRKITHCLIILHKTISHHRVNGQTVNSGQAGHRYLWQVHFLYLRPIDHDCSGASFQSVRYIESPVSNHSLARSRLGWLGERAEEDDSWEGEGVRRKGTHSRGQSWTKGTSSWWWVL